MQKKAFEMGLRKCLVKFNLTCWCDTHKLLLHYSITCEIHTQFSSNCRISFDMHWKCYMATMQTVLYLQFFLHNLLITLFFSFQINGFQAMPEYFNIACRFNAIPIADVYSDLYIYVTFAVWDLQFGNFHIYGKFPTNMPQNLCASILSKSILKLIKSMPLAH